MNDTDPNTAAPDGSPVGLYARLPVAHQRAKTIHEAIPAGCTILDLGAGTGRVTHPLLELGHPVVAVDESAEMLEHIRGAETVTSRIEDLNLGRVFPTVLLLSFLVSYESREALLDACRRHVAPDGAVIIERESPEWFDQARPREWEHDGIHFAMTEVERLSPTIQRCTIEYTMGPHFWTHTFTSHRLGDDVLHEILAAADLRFDRFLDDGQSGSGNEWDIARSLILARPI